jgi:anti-anti-sigma regulatory factor
VTDSSVLDDVRPPAPYGHTCWSFDDPAAFERHALDYLAAGLAAGERVWYVGPGATEDVARRVTGGGASGHAFGEALRGGAAAVVGLSTAYATGAIVEPAAQVAAYAAATDQAVADGFAGLRVAADATALVRTPAQLDAFARYEHLVDRYIHAGPFSAVCGYDRGELGDPAVAALACLHAGTNADVPFRLHACAPADGCAALAGELDASTHELLTAALEHADLRPVDGELVFDGGGLRFADHRSLLLLREHARRLGADAVVRTGLPVLARLAALMDLPGLRVVSTR